MTKTEHDTRVQNAKDLFVQKPGITAPIIVSKYLEYNNAIAESFRAGLDLRMRIYVSPFIVENFTAEELAGILGHEFAHLEYAAFFGGYSTEEQADLRGAALVGCSSMIAAMKKTQQLTHELLFWDQVLIISFPVLYESDQVSLRSWDYRLKNLYDNNCRSSPR